MNNPKFGFKEVALDNWREIDPIWDVFFFPGADQDRASTWVTDLLRPRLQPIVPTPVRALFEVARAAFIYGLMFYPLQTLGAEQMCRVAEAAIGNKCHALADRTRRNFAGKISWLTRQGAISSQDAVQWKAIRELRNAASHPTSQTILNPGMTIPIMEEVADLVNRLFSRNSNGQTTDSETACAE